jgi:hypothetical protein
MAEKDPVVKSILKELGLDFEGDIAAQTGETTISPEEKPPAPFGELPLTPGGIPIGIEKNADMLVALAIKGLEEALIIYGATSEKGKAVLDAIKKLSNIVDESVLKEIEVAVAGFLGLKPMAPIGMPPEIPLGQGTASPGMPPGMSPGMPSGMPPELAGLPPIGGGETPTS